MREPRSTHDHAAEHRASADERSRCRQRPPMSGRRSVPAPGARHRTKPLERAPASIAVRRRDARDARYARGVTLDTAAGTRRRSHADGARELRRTTAAERSSAIRFEAFVVRSHPVFLPQTLRRGRSPQRARLLSAVRAPCCMRSTISATTSLPRLHWEGPVRSRPPLTYACAKRRPYQSEPLQRSPASRSTERSGSV
jgi:hypothetical protein